MNKLLVMSCFSILLNTTLTPNTENIEQKNITKKEILKKGLIVGAALGAAITATYFYKKNQKLEKDLSEAKKKYSANIDVLEKLKPFMINLNNHANNVKKSFDNVKNCLAKDCGYGNEDEVTLSPNTLTHLEQHQNKINQFIDYLNNN